MSTHKESRGVGGDGKQKKVTVEFRIMACRTITTPAEEALARAKGYVESKCQYCGRRVGVRPGVLLRADAHLLLCFQCTALAEVVSEMALGTPSERRIISPSGDVP